jgi:hypothetical protein
VSIHGRTRANDLTLSAPRSHRLEAMSAASALEDGPVGGRELGAGRHGPLTLDLRLDEPARGRGHQREALEALSEDMPPSTEPDVRAGPEHRDVGIHGAMVGGHSRRSASSRGPEKRCHMAEELLLILEQRRVLAGAGFGTLPLCDNVFQPAHRLAERIRSVAARIGHRRLEGRSRPSTALARINSSRRASIHSLRASRAGPSDDRAYCFAHAISSASITADDRGPALAFDRGV